MPVTDSGCTVTDTDLHRIPPPTFTDKTYAGQGLFMTPLEKMEKKAKPKTKRVTVSIYSCCKNLTFVFDSYEFDSYYGVNLRDFCES